MKPDEIESTGSATYSPEDNKLRLYVGRVPRGEYEKLRAEGWTSTPKQDCNFVATWTPERRDTALAYGDGVIEDEDQPMAERAADRAERFGGYRDKRTNEATGHADRYDAGPSAHGYQNQARAERAAARHDRIGTHATDAWSKAEYWQRRTAGVISHALYKSQPGVRMGRIKELEASLRKHQKEVEERAKRFRNWTRIAAETDLEKQNKLAALMAGYSNSYYAHPITGKEESLYRIAEDPQVTGAQVAALWLSNHSEPAEDDDWSTHYKLRLAYENQMLEAQGGRAAHVEMEVGGFVGNYQIRKVNKSPTTGRVVSVQVLEKTGASYDRQGKAYGPDNPRPMTLHTLNIERLSKEVYRAATPEELEAFNALRKAEKAAAPKVATIPLINPTDEDAERLQAVWNSQRAHRYEIGGNEPKKVQRVTQAQYSANSGGTYSKCETTEITGGGFQRRAQGYMDTPDCPTVAKVRATHSGCVVIITDKPQKPLPAAAWHDPRPEIVKELEENFDALEAVLSKDWLARKTEDEQELFNKGRIVGLVYSSSMSQFGFTDKGHEWARQIRNARKALVAA